MTAHVLVVNAGSSSLKYSAVEVPSGVAAATGVVEEIGGESRWRHRGGDDPVDRPVDCADHVAAFELARQGLAEHTPSLDLGDVVAVGHRVVHGGSRFNAPTVVDDEVLATIEELAPLAPLHNPANLAGIRGAMAALSDVPHVAVFDTAFHQTLPESASTYAVPRAWREELRVRRYGFHGTSYAYVSRRIAELVERPVAELATIVLHLGNGASACAVDGGRSVDTSMGLTPCEGLVMGTRSGDVDPALGGFLARVAGLDAEAYDRALNRDSGLLGLTGASDFRRVLELRAQGDADADRAYGVVVHRLRKYVGAYAAVLGRLDALVFTGGIGEHNPGLRADVISGLGLLGLGVDEAANADGPAERRISPDGSAAAAWVVPTDEEGEIARSAYEVGVGG